MNIRHAFTKPAWTKCDRTTDVSDLWMEHMDPGNEDGALATACFSAEPTDEAGWLAFTLEGLVIETPGLTEYRDRQWVIATLGADAVWALECYETESRGYTPRHDREASYWLEDPR